MTTAASNAAAMLQQRSNSPMTNYLMSGAAGLTDLTDASGGLAVGEEYD